MSIRTSSKAFDPIALRVGSVLWRPLATAAVDEGLGELGTTCRSLWAQRFDPVKAELSGMKKIDIVITFDDGDLVISGERKSEEKVEEKDYYRMERSHGRVYRRFPLPHGVSADQIKANFADEIPEVTTSKPSAGAPAKTTIRSSR
jgi:HSP20 family protein